MLRLKIALLVALVLPFSARAAGHDVSTIQYAPSQLVSSSAVAFNAGRFLTVWSMQGNAVGALTDPTSGTTSAPFVLPGITGQEQPLVIGWGNGFLSLWKTWDYFQIVTLTANGVIEHVSRVSVERRYQSWKMASNGLQLLVIDETDFNFEGTDHASLYEPDGTLLARTTLPVIGVTSFDVARDGDSYAVVTGGYRGVHFFRIDDGGTIVGERELQGPPPPYSDGRVPDVAVAGDAAHAVVAWTATGATGAYATTVSSSNDVTALQPLPIKYAYYPHYPDPAIRAVPTTAGCLILWNETGHVSLLRTNAAGQIIDAEPIQVATGELKDVTAVGDQLGIITSPAGSAGPVSIFIGTARPAGVRTSTSSVVTLAAARQEQPVIASDGVDYVSVWLEHEGTDLIAKIGRVTRAGIPLDGPGLALPSATKYTWNVSIARGPGSDALVVVSADQGLVALRWSRTAGLLDTTPIVLDPKGADFGAAVAWNGSRYLVLWNEFGSPSLAGRFVGSDGTLGARITIPMSVAEFASEAHGAAMAWDGRQFLVASPTSHTSICNADPCGPAPAEEVRLVRLSADGTLLDRAPYRMLGRQTARVATSGSEFLVLTSNYDTFSAVVVHGAASGLSVSAPVMTITPVITINGGRACDVTWNGTSYSVAWTGSDYWLRQWRLDRSGGVLQKLFTTASSPYPPSVAANDAGEVAIAISEDAAPSGLSRARIYFGSEIQPVPSGLATPTNAVSHLAGSYAAVKWDGDAPRFLIEKLYPPAIAVNAWYVVQELPGDVHESSVYASAGETVRIRAYGPDGSTPDGAITTIHSEPRTRPVRR